MTVLKAEESPYYWIGRLGACSTTTSLKCLQETMTDCLAWIEKNKKAIQAGIEEARDEKGIGLYE